MLDGLTTTPASSEIGRLAQHGVSDDLQVLGSAERAIGVSPNVSQGPEIA
jgi:hypothetical protein